MSLSTLKSIVLQPAEMKALLAGKKTRKRVPIVFDRIPRRLVNGKYLDRRNEFNHQGIEYIGVVDTRAHLHVFQRAGASKPIKVTCPFGADGDVLAVREAYAYAMIIGKGVYGDALFSANKDYICYQAGPKVEGMAFCPPVIGKMMPLHFSRMALRVNVPHVERLWDVDEDGAHAEGFEHRDHYKRAYAKQHGAWAWGNNPFMWAMDFEVVDTSKDVWEWQNTLIAASGGRT